MTHTLLKAKARRVESELRCPGCGGMIYHALDCETDLRSHEPPRTTPFEPLPDETARAPRDADGPVTNP